MSDRYGVVLSSASSMTGGLVTPIPSDWDVESFVEMIERLQPGVRAIPVSDVGNGQGWRTDNGYSPEKVVEMLGKDPLLAPDAFDDKRGPGADYYMLDGVLICLEHDDEIDYRYGCRFCPREQ